MSQHRKKVQYRIKRTLPSKTLLGASFALRSMRCFLFLLMITLHNMHRLGSTTYCNAATYNKQISVVLIIFLLTFFQSVNLHCRESVVLVVTGIHLTTVYNDRLVNKDGRHHHDVFHHDSAQLAATWKAIRTHPG